MKVNKKNELIHVNSSGDITLKFAKVDHVAFNNRAVQDLRMNKVKQKISGSFRKSIYAQAYCRITSYLKTMSNKGINLMIAIHKVLLNEL